MDIDYALNALRSELQGDIRDVRFDLERQIEDQRHQISRLEERCDVLKEELRAEREAV